MRMLESVPSAAEGVEEVGLQQSSQLTRRAFEGSSRFSKLTASVYES